MATTTPNFGWDVPQSTDLVKDGATAIAALGNDIDAALVDLKGGTTGQILSKNSNTDLDYTWINNDQGDITAVNVTSPITGGGTSGAVTIGIQAGSTTQSGALQLTDSTSSTSTTTAATPNSVKSAYDLANAAIAKAIVDAKGDIIAATAADTVSRLAVGSNDQVLTADSSAATGLKWATPVTGSFTQLASGTFPNNSNTVSITGISSSYKNLVMVFTQLVFASTSSNLQIRFNEDGNANRHATNTTFGDTAPGSFNATSWTCSREQNTGAGNNNSLIVATFFDYANSTTWKIAQGYGLTVSDANSTQYKFRNSIGLYNQTTALSSFTLISSSGDFSAGSYIIYGVK